MTDANNRRLLDVLSTMADALVSQLDADACAISRVIGDVLILVAETVPNGATLQQGQGYLVPDFPQTSLVLKTGTPRSLTLDDPNVDEAEAAVLVEHGFGSLMMAPLDYDGATWGLVEVYRVDRRPFTESDIRLALELSRVH